MTAAAFALVLVSALLHASWNLVAKRAGGDGRFVMLVALMAAVGWAPVGLWVGWSVVPGWGWREWGLVLASALTHFLYFNLLLRGYRLADLTVVYPVARGTGPLLTAGVATLLLGESLGPLGIAGVLGVTLGVLLIAGGPGLWRALRAGSRPDGAAPSAHGGPAASTGPGEPAAAASAVPMTARARVLTGIGYGAATGLMIAGYTLIDGYAVKVALMSPILVDYFGNLCRIPFALPAALRDRAATVRAWRRQWRHALLIAAISPLAYVLVLYAMTMAPLSLVAPARELSMLFAAVLGGRLLGEGDRLLRLAGAACIAAGVAALTLS